MTAVRLKPDTFDNVARASADPMSLQVEQIPVVSAFRRTVDIARRIGIGSHG
jgi:hypothetical protein